MSSETNTEPMTDSGLGITEKAPPMMFADDFQKELEQSPEWQEMEKSLKATLAQFNADPTPEAADIPLIKAEEDVGKELEIPVVPPVYEIGSSLQNRLGLVDEEFRCEILNQVQDDVINWIRNIFRFQAATVNAYKDPRQPMLKALRCALAVKYNQQNEETPLGYKRYVSSESVKTPVIYVTDDIPSAWILYFQSELGLPKECFNVHRINDGINGDKTPFDVNKLFKQVQQDANDPQKEPTALIGSFGSESGIDDKVESLLHICGKFSIWCHFEGDNIPMLGNFTIPSKSAPILAANSITLKPSDFCMLGLPSLFCMRSANNPIRCQPWEDELLPVWTALQLSGAANIRHRINNAMRITNDLVLVLKQFADVNSSVQERVEEHADADYSSFGDFVKDTMKQLTAPPAPPLVTVFQWNSPTEVVTNEFTDALLDVCNYKLLMTLQDKCEKIDCQETMNDEGSCIRIRSLVTALKGAQQADLNIMKETIDSVLPSIESYFDQAWDLWRSTSTRSDIKLFLEPNEDLKLGAIAIIPKAAPADVINQEVFQCLIEEDSGVKFSLAKAGEDMVIAIDEIPAEIDIENMINSICELGVRAEEEYRRNEEVKRRMLEALKLAEKSLEDEKEKRISEGGIIWPVWSWISGGKQPVEETQGRTFSVVSDKMKVIENVKEDLKVEDDENTDVNLIENALATKVSFRRKGDETMSQVSSQEAREEVNVLENKALNVEDNANANNNSETNALSEVTDVTADATEIHEEVNEELAMNKDLITDNAELSITEDAPQIDDPQTVMPEASEAGTEATEASEMPDVNPEDEHAADTTTETNPPTVTEEGEVPAEQKSFSLSSIFF